MVFITNWRDFFPEFLSKTKKKTVFTLNRRDFFPNFHLRPKKVFTSIQRDFTPNFHVQNRGFFLSNVPWPPIDNHWSIQTKTEHLFLGSACKSFVRLGSPMGNNRKCLSQEHNDAWPVRESNWELATFRSVTRRLAN